MFADPYRADTFLSPPMFLLPPGSAWEKISAFELVEREMNFTPVARGRIILGILSPPTLSMDRETSGKFCGLVYQI